MDQRYHLWAKVQKPTSILVQLRLAEDGGVWWLWWVKCEVGVFEWVKLETLFPASRIYTLRARSACETGTDHSRDWKSVHVKIPTAIDWVERVAIESIVIALVLVVLETL